MYDLTDQQAVFENLLRKRSHCVGQGVQGDLRLSVVQAHRAEAAYYN